MKAANPLGAKTARACDSCLRRRARWFCGADDAFLCHACDNLVHSANQLASRHERVRLQTASCKKPAVLGSSTPQQAWHSGFRRKARTPRHGNKHLLPQQQQPCKHEDVEEEEEGFFNCSVHPVVPELGSEEGVVEESEEQLLCRVPVLEPFEAELCNIYSEIGDDRFEGMLKKDDEEACDLDDFPDLLGSDMDIAEFAADVESLLQTTEAVESGAQMFDCKREDEAIMGDEIKIKDEQVVEGNAIVEMITSEAFMNWNNTESNTITNTTQTQSSSQEEEEVVGKAETKRKIFLRLNYEDVISAWASQGCPWTTGHPPQLNSHDCLEWGGAEDVEQWSYGRLMRGQVGDGGREARVTRYREKRRTRLFAKKIRYEVRKLNAEKRPRMKGRFVKRASFLPNPVALPPPAASR